MSTCPDPDLFSAYFDGEVPSPWKEKIERHLASCPSCAALTGRFSTLRQTLTREGSMPALSPERMEASFARLSAKRAAVLERRNDRTETRLAEWFHASVSVPLPALAALLAVAIILPSAITLSSRTRDASAPGAFLARTPSIAPGTSSMRVPVSSFSVFSEDLPELAVPRPDAANDKTRLFTMVDYARQFDTDRELFQDAEIVIIKLPKLAHFNEDRDFAREQGDITSFARFPAR